MKQIFKPLQWAIIASQLLFVFTACEEDHTAPQADRNNLLRIEVTAEKPTWIGEGTTRVTDTGTTLSWEAGDKLYGRVSFFKEYEHYGCGGQDIVITRNAENTGWSSLEISIPLEATHCYYALDYIGKHTPEESAICFDTPIIAAGANVRDLSIGTIIVDEFRHLLNRYLFTGLSAGSTLWLKANEWRGWKPSEAWTALLTDHAPITVGADGTALVYGVHNYEDEYLQTINIAITTGSTPDQNTQWHDLKELLANEDGGMTQTIDVSAFANITPGGTTGIE